ncbi:MFS transporter [Streptomyces sp. NPDC048389]|uniref:MFS transporter n=1 Tax=Streptomyces sp. NPDC048389 TaxID=3154622 RepID=UPI00345557DB
MSSRPASEGRLSGARSGAVYVLLLALGALDAAGYSLIAPVLPTLASLTGGGATAMGMLVATFPLGMVAGFAVGGAAVQRTTPAKVILAGLLLICAGCLGFVFRTGLVDLCLARLVMGLGSGCLWLGITFATLAAWPGREYVCMSRVFAAYSVGGLLGPLLGAIHGVRGPFAAYLLLTAAAVIPLLVLRLPARTGAFTTDRSALRSRDFRAAAAGIAFAVLGLGMVEGVLPLHFGTKLGQSQIALLYAATSVVVATVAVLAARLRPRRALLGSTVLMVVGFTAAGAGSAVPVWIGALVLVGAGIGMANTGSIGVLLEAVPAERIVTAMVLWSQIGILGYLLAPVLGGPLADAHGYAAVAGLVALAAVMVVAELGPRGRT